MSYRIEEFLNTKMTRREFLVKRLPKYLLVGGAAVGTSYFFANLLLQPNPFNPQTPEIYMIEDFDHAYVTNNKVQYVSVKITPSEPKTKDGEVYPKFFIAKGNLPDNSALGFELISGTEFSIDFNRNKKGYKYFSYFSQNLVDTIVISSYFNEK